MQLIREAKSREGRGLNEKGRLGRVKKRAKAKIKSAQGEGRVQINYRFVSLSKLEDGCFLGSDANLMLVETCVPTGQTALAYSLCSLLSGRHKIHFLWVSFFLISRLLSGLFAVLFLLLFSFSVSFSPPLLLCRSICPLFLPSLLPTHIYVYNLTCSPTFLH